MSHVLVAGIGYTGGRILQRLPDATGLNRSPVQSTKAIMMIDLDAEVPPPIRMSSDYSVIYTVPPAGDQDMRLPRLLAAAPRPKRFVYLSTTGVYGDCGGERVVESTPVNPESPRAKRRAAAEQLLTAWAQDTDCELVILRVSGIYGPGRLGEERLRRGDSILAEGDALPGNRIHVDDLANCCIAALNAPPGVYNVGDGDYRSATWFMSELARQLGLREPTKISRSIAEQTLTAERLSFLKESRRVDTRKMREVLAVTPIYEDAALGIKASLTSPQG